MTREFLTKFYTRKYWTYSQILVQIFSNLNPRGKSVKINLRDAKFEIRLTTE